MKTATNTRPCFDKHGHLILPGMRIRMADGKVEEIYEVDDLTGQYRTRCAISASNEAFLARHPDWSREYYVLNQSTAATAEIVR